MDGLSLKERPWNPTKGFLNVPKIMSRQDIRRKPYSWGRNLAKTCLLSFLIIYVRRNWEVSWKVIQIWSQTNETDSKFEEKSCIH